jgi:hypothetical protein
MKKLFSFICGIGLLISYGCASEINSFYISSNLIKKDVYLNGKKVVLYEAPNERAVVKGNKIEILNSNDSISNGHLVFYTSKYKSPYTRLVATNKFIIYLGKYSPEEIEEKYGIKFVKYINKDLKMALFKGKEENILDTVNRLNKDGIKASIDFIRKFKLY